MGNDGGSIPTRRELVKEAAKNPSATEMKESQHEQQEYYWTTDPISQQPLTGPVVSDCNGRLYNKETILEFLVEGARKEDAEVATHGAVKSLKDVVEVKFEIDGDSSKANNDKAAYKSWKCPVTGDTLGPGSKAVYLVPCGHAFSGSAIKEVSGERCVTCDTEYASNDIIPIISTSETDIARLSLRMMTLKDKGLTHSLKKASGSKKRKKKHEDAENSVEAANVIDTNGANSPPPRSSTPLNGTNGKIHSTGINNTSTASLTAKVMEEQEAKKRKRESDNVRSLFSSKDPSKPQGRSGDFMTRGFSIPSEAKR